MACRIFAVLLLLACSALPVHAVPYFPSESGPIFDYPTGTVTISNRGGSFSRNSTVGYASYFWHEFEGFQVTAEGDILKSYEGSNCSACPDPDITEFDPPYMLLDFPLTTGKTWITETMTPELCCSYEPVPITVIGAVEGPAIVTVPAGTFEVIKVRIYRLCPARPQLNQDFVYWLHPQLGPVNDLVSWEGVIPVEPSSWSDLQALYR